MSSVALAILLTVDLLALIYALLLTLHAWESRRFVRGRLAYDLFGRNEGAKTLSRAVVLAPCKGADEHLEANLLPLFEQGHSSYAIVFIVESEEDAAAPVIRRLIEQNPHVSAHLFVAGRAVESGQKVHNLLETIEHLSPRFDVLAFTDADARHHPNWLRSLTAHLYWPGVGATTGYRWFVPERFSLPNLLLYSINSSVAGLFGRGATNFVWGGSWAIRREVFERVRMRGAWRGTLSDDMVARRAIREAGFQIDFEPRCIAASMTDVTWSQLFEFVRRQYLIGRRYAPRMWAAALLANTLAQLAAWTNFAIALVGLAAGWSLWWAPALACAALYGLNVVRGVLRQKSGRQYLPQHAKALSAARRFDIWAGPLVGLVNWLGMASSLAGDTITWGGNRYRIAAGGKISLLDGASPPALEEPSQISCEIRIRAIPEGQLADDDTFRRSA